MHWNEIIRTLMASPKSYHSSLWRSTLKEAFFSALKGDLYHTLFPRCITGSYPNPAKKSTSLMSFASCMFIAWHFSWTDSLLPHKTKNILIPGMRKTKSSDVIKSRQITCGNRTDRLHYLWKWPTTQLYHTVRSPPVAYPSKSIFRVNLKTLWVISMTSELQCWRPIRCSSDVLDL